MRGTVLVFLALLALLSGAASGEPVKIRVVDPRDGGRHRPDISATVDTEDSLWSIANQVRKHWGFEDAHAYVLTFGGQALDMAQPARAYGIDNGAHIEFALA